MQPVTAAFARHGLLGCSQRGGGGAPPQAHEPCLRGMRQWRLLGRGQAKGEEKPIRSGCTCAGDQWMDEERSWQRNS